VIERVLCDRLSIDRNNGVARNPAARDDPDEGKQNGAKRREGT
jgi:hypothetical protein